MFRQRRRIRPVIAAVAAGAAGLLALAGCSTAGNTSNNSSSKSITVSILQAPGFNDCLADVIPQFTKDTGVKVTLAKLPYSSMLDKYQASFNSGGSDYDLVNIAFQWTGQFAAAGYLQKLDLSKVSEMNGVSDTLKKQYDYKSDSYGVPYLSSVMGYFYRTDILQQLGLKVPTTVDELNTVLDKINSDASLGVKPISVMGDPTQGMANFNGLYHAEGGPAFENSKSEANPIDVDAATKALEQLKKMVALSPAGALTATFATTPAQFASGSVAVLPQFNTAPGNLFDSSTSKIIGKYTFAAAPGGAGDLGGWGFAVPSSSKNKDAAEKFATYLASPSADLTCATKFGKSPVQTQNFSNPDVLKTLPYMPEVSKVLATGTPRFTGSQAGTQNDVVDTITGQYLSGQISDATTAAQQMADQVKAAAAK